MTPNDDADSLFLTDGSLRPELLGEGVPAALQEAVRQAVETNWDSVRTPHVFMGLLTVPDAGVRNWGEHLQADLPDLLPCSAQSRCRSARSSYPVGPACRP